MSAAANRERLQRLLGGSELADLRGRLRARYERGAELEVFTLRTKDTAERRALEGLLGRAMTEGKSIRLRQSELDAAIARAGLASDLRNALEVLDGPLHDRKAERLARREAWRALLERTRFELDPAALVLLKRCAGGDPNRARLLLEQTGRVLARLPARGIPLARLAAETLGDSHALDAGRPIAALTLSACAPEGDEPRRSRDRWAEVGVSVNELAAPALCLNLRVASVGDADGGAPQAPMMRLADAAGEPAYLALRSLLRRRVVWDVADRCVFVCENPAILAIAADALGKACAPLVCTGGMPAAAQRTLLAQLAADGARLRYHGDFDWPGIRIGNFVMREFGALAWRFGADDYLAAADSGGGLPLNDAERVAAAWDANLSIAMAGRAVAIHEEAVADVLIGDLSDQRCATS
jgi:uncharacterized protein (TIGR02679 family)